MQTVCYPYDLVFMTFSYCFVIMVFFFRAILLNHHDVIICHNMAWMPRGRGRVNTVQYDSFYYVKMTLQPDPERHQHSHTAPTGLSKSPESRAPDPGIRSALPVPSLAFQSGREPVRRERATLRGGGGGGENDEIYRT